MYDDGVCGIEISSLPIDVWHLSMLYRYVDILTGDRMIVGISISVRLATGFGGFMPSHSLAPVMIPQIWVVTLNFLENWSFNIVSKPSLTKGLRFESPLCTLFPNLLI